jgi:predicted O-methyltransferase YrrM
MELDERVRSVREQLGREGPPWARSNGDFQTVTLPERDCDLVRDLLVAERARTVVEIGLAYGSSALAIGEALAATRGARHVVIDPFQESAFSGVGWDLLCSAGLDAVAELVEAPSSAVLPRLLNEGFVADAAFVDGSHRYHEVFVDLYFLRKLVRPGGLIILDDNWAPSIRTAAHYYERNLGWERVAGAFDAGSKQHVANDPGNELVTRCVAYRVPEPFEPPFEDFRPF